MEKLVDPGSGPRGPLPEIGVHYLNLEFNFDTNGEPPKIRSIFPAKQHQVVDPDFPGSTTFSNFDGPGVVSKINQFFFR